MKLLNGLAILIIFVLAAPFLSGLITKVKNDLRLRRGQSLWQPYFNLAKLFNKEEVVSGTASWIFRAAPVIVLASSLTAVFCLREFITLLFVLALGRFFLALAALDTGSAFGGMGSSREMFISSLAEPVAVLSGFALTLQFGTTDFVTANHGVQVSTAALLSGLSLFMVALAETSRLPVDNQETHLELTMVHEAMILEYSGRKLAAMELAAQVKQFIWIFIIAQIIFPLAAPLAGAGSWLWLGWLAAKIVMVSVIIGLLEVMIAKARLFRVADVLSFAFILGALAIICAILRY
jgi:formate hydrogenlyase subunit 4